MSKFFLIYGSAKNLIPFLFSVWTIEFSCGIFVMLKVVYSCLTSTMENHQISLKLIIVSKILETTNTCVIVYPARYFSFLHVSLCTLTWMNVIKMKFLQWTEKQIFMTHDPSEPVVVGPKMEYTYSSFLRALADQLAPTLRQTRAPHEIQYTRYITYSDTLKYSFFPCTIPIWNALPASVVSVECTQDCKSLI